MASRVFGETTGSPLWDGRLSFGPKQFRPRFYTLDYISVMHQCQDQLCLICHERKHKNNRPTIWYIFAFCIHERDLNSRTLSSHSYTGPFMNTFSSTKKDTEHVSSVLLDDFGHFLGRFLRNFAEEFFKSGNFTANQILKHSTFPRLFPRIFVGKGLQMRFS